MGADHIIVGVDYGTTYSGVSFALSRATGIDDVEVLDRWGASSSSYAYQKQVPSRISYNPDTWGYETRGQENVYVWSKLLLDDHVKATDFDDGGLSYSHIYGQGFMTTPPNKSAKQLVTDYLKGLYSQIIAELERRLTKPYVDTHPIKFWFTMPAIWSIKAQNATRDAATKAGFGSRPLDDISLIREPEAAAIACLSSLISKGPDPRVKAGFGVLVCDCGGGTVDLASYEIVKAYPKVQLNQACISEGGKCGSTAIDRGFVELMQRRFGSAFTNLPLEKRGPGSKFMDEFESAKRDFGHSKLARETRLRLNMKVRDGLYDEKHFDEDEREVILSHEDMKGLFDPVVVKILGLLEQQIKATEAGGKVKIDAIVLVGGFGESPYLYKKLKEWCPPQITLTCPPISWHAICLGAAVRGLEGPVVMNKKSKLHIGHAIREHFRDGIDSEEYAQVCNFNGAKYATNYVRWHIARGETVTSETTKKANFNWHWSEGKSKILKLKLFESAMAMAPERDTHSSVNKIGYVEVDLSGYDVSKFESRLRDGVKHYQFSFDLIIVVEDDLGYMHFRVEIEGKVAGEARLRFGDEEGLSSPTQGTR